MALFDHLLLISSGISVWLSYTLLSRIKAKVANLFLGLCLLTAFFYLFRTVAYSNELHLTNTYLLFLPINWSAGVGPLLFLYFKYLFRDQSKFKWMDLIHLTPLLVQIVFQAYWYAMPFDRRLIFFDEIYQKEILRYEVLLTGFLTTSYILATYWVLGHLVKRWKDAVIKDSKKIIQWSGMLLTVLPIYALLAMLLLLVHFYFTDTVPPHFSYFSFCLLTIVYIMWMGYYISLYPVITIGRLTFIPSSNRDKEFEKSMEALILSRSFDCQRGPHTIDELAACLEVDIHFLSNYLKIHYGVNYPGYIRKLRMDKFYRLVTDAGYGIKDISIKELQIQCGYRNRASFNRDVKEVYHYSPSKYLEKLNLYDRAERPFLSIQT